MYQWKREDLEVGGPLKMSIRKYKPKQIVAVLRQVRLRLGHPNHGDGGLRRRLRK